MTDAPADRALHALDKAHTKRVRVQFERLVLQMETGTKPELAASNFRRGLENSEAAYLLAKTIVGDVFGAK